MRVSCQRRSGPERQPLGQVLPRVTHSHASSTCAPSINHMNLFTHAGSLVPNISRSGNHFPLEEDQNDLQRDKPLGHGDHESRSQGSCPERQPLRQTLSRASKDALVSRTSDAQAKHLHKLASNRPESRTSAVRASSSTPADRLRKGPRIDMISANWTTLSRASTAQASSKQVTPPFTYQALLRRVDAPRTSTGQVSCRVCWRYERQLLGQAPSRASMRKPGPVPKRQPLG